MRVLLLLVVLILLSLGQPVQGTWDTCQACGLRPMTYFGYGTARVVGGTDAQPGAWPWIVSIQMVLENGVSHVCGGSLITSQWVLTAAHCFFDTRHNTVWRVVAGVNRLTLEGPETQVRYPRQIIYHRDYEHYSKKNDIALIELDQPIQCSPYVQIVCLPDAWLQVRQLTNCYVSGWGSTTARSAKTSRVLQEAQVHLIDTQICNSTGWYRGAIHPYNLCAGYPQGGIDTCQGDSGGPLVCQDPRSDQFWLVGITSWGQGCARARRPGVYISTQHFGSWILAQMGLRSGEAAAPTQGAHTLPLITFSSAQTPPPKSTEPSKLSSCLFPMQNLLDLLSRVQELLQVLRGGQT